MSETLTGGCQCGRIRYAVRVASRDAYLCHCRMCQRATGGVAAAMVGVPRAAIEWATEPDWYASSPIARRPFCATCGTPLGFDYLDGASSDLLVGTFDDPSRFVPTAHYGSEALHEAWLDGRALPRQRTDATPTIAARWAGAGRDVPD